MEQSWLSTLGDKVQATDNLPESTEAVNEALEVQMQTHTLFFYISSVISSNDRLFALVYVCCFQITLTFFPSY